MVTHHKLNRTFGVASALVLALAALVPALLPTQASAYTLPDHREIKLSTSAASASGVTYHVSWHVNTASGYTIKGIIVDFCSNSPIIGDSCSAPAGFSVGTPTISNLTGISGGTWVSGAASANTNRTLVLTDSTGNALTTGGFGTGDNISFDLTTATNPSASNTTFYARILTYTNDSGANSPATYTDTAPGTTEEAGGIAMSTADEITLQSKVQERITFCVYTSAVSFTNCTVSTTNPVSLGDANGVLSSTTPSISKTAKYNITTNASQGATIRAKATGTLTSGSFTIDPVNAGSATGTTYSANTEQFGLCTYRDTGGGTAGLTPDANYDGDPTGGSSTTECTGTTAGQSASNDNGARFTFDTTTGGDNFTTTYGDTIASKAAGDFSTGVLVFLGGVSNTTEPGIYTTTLTFIATGNY